MILLTKLNQSLKKGESKIDKKVSIIFSKFA